jgi:hypothetical protein
MSSSIDAIDSFVESLIWPQYVGASYGFLGLRVGPEMRNVGCRIIFTTAPPDSTWQFSQDIDDLVVRRGWIPRAELRTVMSGLRSNYLVLDSERIALARMMDQPYHWTHLPSGPLSSAIIGWRARRLHGLGDNQYQLVGHPRFEELERRLRIVEGRPFSGWQNLAAFLGEGGAPFAIADSAGCLVEIFAPHYARFQPSSVLREDGQLDVAVECLVDPTVFQLRLQLDRDGSAAPLSLGLSPVSGGQLFRHSSIPRPPILKARLTLMLGGELSDSLELPKPDAGYPEDLDGLLGGAALAGGGIRSIADQASALDSSPTHLDQLKRRAGNIRWLAWLLMGVLVIIGAGKVAESFESIQKFLGSLTGLGGAATEAPHGGESGGDLGHLAPPPAVGRVIATVRQFKDFRSSSATAGEAIRILASAGLTRIAATGDSTSVTAHIDDSWCVTLWPGSYNQNNVYGARYGPCSRSPSWDPQRTYFELVIPIQASH